MSRYWNEELNEPRPAIILRDVCLITFALIVAMMAGVPQYKVWEQSLVGKAALKRAEQDRQISVQEAQAKMDSADLLAKAEVARAKGVAEANAIIAGGLGGADGYLRYLYINALGEHAGKLGQVIYVPTEAGLPILEAGRLK
jgi:regulator of protease activity HflC (stomatin/prohibitin superfamily)